MPDALAALRRDPPGYGHVSFPFELLLVRAALDRLDAGGHMRLQAGGRDVVDRSRVQHYRLDTSPARHLDQRLEVIGGGAAPYR